MLTFHEFRPRVIFSEYISEFLYQNVSVVNGGIMVWWLRNKFYVFFKPKSHDLLVDNSCVDQHTGNLCNDELEKVYDSTCGDSGTPGSSGKNESRKYQVLSPVICCSWWNCSLCIGTYHPSNNRTFQGHAWIKADISTKFQIQIHEWNIKKTEIVWFRWFRRFVRNNPK